MIPVERFIAWNGSDRTSVKPVQCLGCDSETRQSGGRDILSKSDLLNARGSNLFSRKLFVICFKWTEVSLLDISNLKRPSVIGGNGGLAWVSVLWPQNDKPLLRLLFIFMGLAALAYIVPLFYTGVSRCSRIRPDQGVH